MRGPRTPVLRCFAADCLLALALAAACNPRTDLPVGSTQISPRDSARLVFVPAGAFLMGSSEADPESEPDERPLHEVYLDAFWMDETESTNAQWADCVAAGACSVPQHSHRYGEPAYAQHPVLGVTHDQAKEYCNWAGRRLPTEAEWEKAARGTEARLYPWGNSAPDDTRANFGGRLGDTAEVGSYPAGASPFGVLDMAGNIWEWVSDAYDAAYYQNSPESNPAGGESPNLYGIRGGNWGAEPRALRSANRFWAFPRRNDTDGLRCALGADG